MKQSRTSIVLVVVFQCIALGSAGLAWSCSCAEEPSPLEALELADVVVTGAVVDRVYYAGYRSVGGQHQDRAALSGEDLIGYEVVVHDVWKGAEEDTIVVYSARSESSCGYRFKVGETYLIYAYRQDTEKLRKHYVVPFEQETLIMTGMCSRTRRLDSAAGDLKGLPEPKRLAKPSDN